MSHMKPLGPSPVLSGRHFASQLPKKGKGSSSSPQWKNSRRPAGPQPSARGRDHLPSGRGSRCAAGGRVPAQLGVDRRADRQTHVQCVPRPRGAAARVASRVRFPGPPRDHRGKCARPRVDSSGGRGQGHFPSSSRKFISPCWGCRKMRNWVLWRHPPKTAELHDALLTLVWMGAPYSPFLPIPQIPVP